MSDENEAAEAAEEPEVAEDEATDEEAADEEAGEPAEEA